GHVRRVPAAEAGRDRHVQRPRHRLAHGEPVGPSSDADHGISRAACWGLMERPIVFMSDYGLADEFVGICHGVVIRIAPQVRVIDLTHAIPRHDVVIGAMALGRSAPFMPKDAVYLGVVDPGVGSARRPVAVACRSGALLVGPDNGVLSMAWATLGGPDQAAEITSERVLLDPVSATFHGRDVFAPAAAHLSIGLPLPDLAPPVDPRTP